MYRYFIFPHTFNPIFINNRTRISLTATKTKVMTASKIPPRKLAPSKKHVDTKPTLNLIVCIPYCAPVLPRDDCDNDAGQLPLRKYIHVSCSKRVLKKKKRVRFAPMASFVARFASHEDLKNSWYGNEDYSSFETECRRTLAALRIEKNNLQNGDGRYEFNSTEFTTSGLEDFLSPLHKNLRNHRKMCHSHNVLMHQFTLRRKGVLSTEALKIISEIYSFESSELALQRGKTKSIDF